ncbi:MAG: leucine-rich repeat protein [Treponemataceae bacterium]|nr:leucine-rich repeat protein [Treponemataceae bacterium]
MKQLILLWGCVFALGLFSCKTVVEEVPANDEDVCILVNGSETMTSLEAGQQYILRLSNSSSANWAVSNAVAATLSAKSGVSVNLSAKSAGSVTVTATVNDKTYTCALQIIKKGGEIEVPPDNGETNAPNVSFTNLSAYKVLVCRDGLSAEITTVEAGDTKTVYVSPGSNEITFHFRYSYCIVDDDDSGTIWVDAADNGAYTYPVDSADIAQGVVPINIPVPKNPQFNAAYLKVENQSTQPVSLYNGNTQQKLYSQEKYYIQPGHSGVYAISPDAPFEGFSVGASPSFAIAVAPFYVVSGAFYQCVFSEYSSTITTTEESCLREPFTVTFETNGGSEIPSITTRLLETTLIPPTTLEGYYFAGWYADMELQRVATFPHIMTADITLYAKWLENTNTPYTVFHFLQDTNRSTYTLKDTESLMGATSAATIASAKNYIGFMAKTFAQKTISADGSTVVNIYYDRNEYTVTFDANSGIGATTKQIFYYGIAQQLHSNLFTHSDYTFIGWAVSATDNPVYSNQAELLIDENAPSNITLYAAWFYTVTDSNIEDMDLTNIQADAYTIKVKGGITQNTFATLASKIKTSTAVSINLDMTEATGITTITADDNATSLLVGCPLNLVSLPKMLEIIEDNAFANCSITSINIPVTVKTIGEYAFSNCSKLESVEIAGAETIGCHAFSNCTSMTSASILAIVKTIGEYAFSDCSKLESVEIGGAETIGYRAFANCTSMTSASLKSVGSIGKEAFFCCRKLESLKIDKAETIGDNAFASCSITSINIPVTVKTIGEYAFSDCSKLASVEIGGAETIGYRAFANCTSMTSASLKSVGSIGKEAFFCCRKLESLKIDKAETIGDNAFASCSITSINIPVTVKTIGEYAFSDCSKLASVEIGGAETIGCYAFANCTSIESVTIKRVGTISSNVFYGANLSALTIEVVGIIEAYAFPSSLQSIVIKSVKSIKDSAFANCTKLSSVIIEAASGISITADTFKNCESLVSLTLKSVGSIGDRAFYQFKNLTAVTIESVGTIGSSAFSYCEELESIKIDGLETIGDSAFANCTKLSSVTIEAASDISIRGDTFQNCESLASLTLKSVGSIDYKAFYQFKNLTSVTIESVGTIGSSAFSYCEELESIKIDGLKTIGAFAFANCTKLSSVIIEDASDISIGNIFQNCKSLASLTLKSVGSIGDRAFYLFKNLTAVSIDVFGSIGSHAFGDCYKLSLATINAKEIGSSAFEYCNSLTTVIIGKRVLKISNSLGYRSFFGCSSLTSVQFEDTEGWYYVDSSNRIYIDVTDATINASKLKSESRTWYKE